MTLSVPHRSSRAARWLAAALTIFACGAIDGAAAPPGLAVRVAARSVRPGELIVLTVTGAEPIRGVRVRAFDRDLPAYRIDARTWRALVGIDLDVAPRTHTVSIEARVGVDAAVHATQELRVVRRTFPTRTLRVDEAFVNPPAEMQARIEGDAAALRQAWQSSAPERLWTKPFVRPVPGKAVSRFGSRSVFNGQPRAPHGGADFISPEGTPVLAPGAGRVLLAHDLYFSGNTVVIDHGLGLFSLLAHLSAFDVREGELVTEGQTVGRVGATGRVTGPHLHWAVRAGGARVDPLSVLALLGPQAR